MKVQACREGDREILATKAGAELVEKAAAMLASDSIDIYLRISVPANWATRCDMQEVVEREVKADRWAWFPADYFQPVTVAPSAEVPCNPHPDAPHGFNRNASHSLGRYVCDCEGWKPE